MTVPHPGHLVMPFSSLCPQLHRPAITTLLTLAGVTTTTLRVTKDSRRWGVIEFAATVSLDVVRMHEDVAGLESALAGIKYRDSGS